MFRCLILQPTGHNESNAVFGTLNHLTMMTGGIIRSLAYDGPLFQVGPDFKCMEIWTRESTASSLKEKWNLTCVDSNLEIASNMRDESRRYSNFPPSDFKRAVNCRLRSSPLLGNSSMLNLRCAAFRKDTTNISAVYVWQCLAETSQYVPCWDYCNVHSVLA